MKSRIAATYDPSPNSLGRGENPVTRTADPHASGSPPRCVSGEGVGGRGWLKHRTRGVRMLFFFLAFLLSACASATPPPYPTFAPTITREITPVPLLLTPVATPLPLPNLPPLIDSVSSKPVVWMDDTLIAVNPDSASVSLVNVASSHVDEIALGGSPRTVTLYEDHALVTLWDQNALALVDLNDHSVRRIESICHMPYGVVTDSRRAYISCFGGDQIVVFDLTREEILYTVDVPDAPYGLALAQNWLLITHLYTGSITVVNVERTPFILGSVNVDTDGELARTLVIAPDGLRAYIPQTRTGLALISLQYMQDWFPVISVFDIAHMRGDREARLVLTEFDPSSNMPSDAAITTDGSRLFVALQGSDVLIVIDTVNGTQIARVPVGASPIGVWLEQNRAYVLNALDGTISVIDAEAYTVIDTIRVTEIPLDPVLLHGKVLFHRAAAPEMSDGAISCATCHYEGGADGRNWINFRSGARNTPALGALIAPYNWAGDMDELHDTIEDQIRNVMLGDGLIAGDFDPTTDVIDAGRSADLDALVAYVESLEIWQSPYLLPDGSLSDPARRGMALFTSGTIGCGCHTPPLYTDQLRHNLAGTVYSMEESDGFDTPTLRGLWSSAPYLHDGVVLTLEELFTRTDPIHSIADRLSAEQLNDLIAFLLSL